MNEILIKILATALTLSQVTTTPDAVKTQFDPAQDQAQVVALLRAGCAHVKKAFDIEAINLDDLIATAMDDPQALKSDVPVFRGINFRDLHTAYRQFCGNETLPDSPIDIGRVITFYNETLTDLPDAAQFRQLKLPGTSVVFDGKGERFTEVFRAGHRRVWVPLSDVPEAVQKAFIAAEDGRFYQHRGVDERGLVRAFVANALSAGRPQGGSTITQQVAKNVLVGSDVSYERKIREVIVASRLEQSLTKPQILELYLNSIYLGRGSWGVEMAARGYFGKPARELSLTEGALLASLAKGPAYYNPDRHLDRSRERYAYVLTRMQEDGHLDRQAADKALRALPSRIAEERERRDSGFHFVDHLSREARTAGIASLTADSYRVSSTIEPALQRAAEAALQEGLAGFESRTGRAEFEGPEANLSEAIGRIAAEPDARTAQPAWQQALAALRLPLYDVHWTAAVVLALPQAKPAKGKQGPGLVQVGLADGRTLPLAARPPKAIRSLKLHDVVFVRVTEAKGRQAQAELRIRPQVQGAAVVLDNRTGRILAMAGAFSYPLSQLNRATQTQRQPGSALKPLTFLAALHRGLQPNTLVEDEPITLPPVGRSNSSILREAEPNSERHYWTPKNFDGTYSGIVTLRQGLERSRNLVTARLLDGGIDGDPERSLAAVCALAVAARLYKDCVPHYPFILGAQPVRLIDLAAFYAAVANEGASVRPYAIESIEQNGRIVYRHTTEAPTWLADGDRAAMFQLKSMLQGVLLRGTAYVIKRLARHVGGKTGTSDDGNDAWFVGFTNEVSVAVWVGYDNGDGKRRTLGGSQTGAKVAIPIFEPIIEAVWASYTPKTVLNGPSPEASRNLVAVATDPATGEPADNGSQRGFVEYFRRGASDTQYRIVSRYQDNFRDRYYQDRPDSGYPFAPWYRGETRVPGAWQGSDGRWYRDPAPSEIPPPPRRRGFFDELLGIFEPPSQREPYDTRREVPYDTRREVPYDTRREVPYGWRRSPYN